MILREYQVQAIEAIRSTLQRGRSALCVLPTGCGKTVIFSKIAQSEIEKNPNIKILVLLNKTSLASQTREKLSEFVNLDSIGMVCGTFAENVVSRVTPATIQSIHKTDEIFDLIIIDECHNVNFNAGRYIKFLNKQIELNPQIKIIGFTATPFRASSGFIYGDSSLFKYKAFEKELNEMIETKALVKPISVRPEFQHNTSSLKVVRGDFDIKQVNEMTENSATSNAQVLDALERIADRKKIVWSCSSIKHCENVTQHLIDAGENAVRIHSKMDQEERAEAKHKFEKEDARHLVFVTIVSEGYDYPPVDCVVLLRPMRSVGMFRQTVGRGLRPFPGKENCLVLDYGQVIESCGSLSSIPKFNGKKAIITPCKDKLCKKCRTINKILAEVCEYCHEEFPKQERKVILDQRPSEVDIFNPLELKANRVLRSELPIRSVRLEDHISKAGNKMPKLIFEIAGLIYRPPVILFFPKFKQWKLDMYLMQIRQVDGTLKAPAKIIVEKNAEQYYDLIDMIF